MPMNKVRCIFCKKLVKLSDCSGRGYITYKSGFKKLTDAECKDCFDKDMEKCFKILKEK